MAGEKLFHLEEQPERALFRPGNLIHVPKSRVTLDLLFAEGLLSPVEIGKKQGREVSKGTWMHESENLYVKFLGFETTDWFKAFKALKNHFETFTESFGITEAYGVVTQRRPDTKLWKEEPYFGIEGQLLPSDMTGLVVPLVPLMIKTNPSAAAMQRLTHVSEEILKAQEAGRIREDFMLYDHFGRVVELK